MEVKPLNNKSGIIAGYIARDYREEQYYKRYAKRKKELEKANKENRTANVGKNKRM